MDDLIQRLRKEHQAVFGVEPAVVAYAPGRVEILGNHTDYNEGFVLSAAIDAGIAFGLSPADEDACTLRAADFGESVRFQAVNPGRTDRERWSNYPRGVLAFLRERYGFRPRGFQGTFCGDIPVAAGLSSSAALEISSGLAFSAFHGIVAEKLALAKIGQRAEHEFAGVRCGLLDQISSLFGREQALVFTDFRSLEADTVSLPQGTAFLIADTGVKHTLVDSEYNERRRRCEEAAAAFRRILGPGIAALRDVTRADMMKYRDRLDPDVWKRAAHPVGENERVLTGAEALKRGDAAAFGRLMFESHESSRKYFENSCPELDALVEAAGKIQGVLGARLSGGGFGGSAVVLVEKDRSPAIAASLASAYAAARGRRLEPRVVLPSAGARLVT
ncbi:MAG: galactokinase [Acidobacteriota bacterium]|nr:galactokinase [Acidobacteriota bacterium]OQB57872.1 MAG: Galactokinase [Candidatus Aminicenantes bacterium ADurb.Bin147]HNQ80790.1 galactokinase [Candidatus Aminicenantes bacterium]MDD8028786.1 galactokinase [Acidobacteriota bacterium]MDD8033019.1 galactokinase [Acidobacteriota bacterium]